MDDVEVKLSVGNCLVKGMTSREYKEATLISRWKAEEFDEKISNSRSKREKEVYLRRKAKIVIDTYYEHLASMIIKHNFKLDGKKLPVFLGDLSDDDVNKVERGGSDASSLTNEELEDFTEPSETKKPRSSKKQSSSSTTTGSSGRVSDGTSKT